MGYFKNLEIEGQVEEPDRPEWTRRRRRETFQPSRQRMTIEVRDFFMLLGMASAGWIAVLVLAVSWTVSL